MVKEEFQVYAAYNQFYILDHNAKGDTDDPSFWTQQASHDKLGVGDGILGIGTGSHGFVKVRVELHTKEPPLDLSRWDHVTVASLELRSGLMLVEGCISESGVFFKIKRPGHYRVRCCHANLAASVDSGTGGDWYLVQVWQAAQRPARVLKCWSPPASATGFDGLSDDKVT